MRRHLLVCLAVLASASSTLAQDKDEPLSEQFPKFILAQAAALRASDRAPATRAEWDARRQELRRRLQEAWGAFPETPCPLEPKVLGTLERDGYRVEKVLFQTRPGVWMTGNTYVPARPGKLPAILMVHGHWRGAHVDPVVQSRCIGAAKLGFFVLVVDAFGAGERAIGTKLGEYHGEMTAATLLPVGLPLSGLQLYENMRAVDYLRSRPEVDGERIGVTGASGGGNQTMYAGSWDDRFRAAVPVCSVGNYQVYLKTACCMCEVVPGALRFTEEGDLLGLTAPRGLMVINATRDAIQFSVAEAKKSLARTADIYQLLGRPDDLRHTIFESGHDYSKAMREAMYGWMRKELMGDGDGQPIPEPEFKTEDPEAIRCFPNDSRPADWMTIPRFATAEAARLLAKMPSPEGCLAQQKQRREALVQVLGGFPAPTPLEAEENAEGKRRFLTFRSEPGLRLNAEQNISNGPKAGTAVLLNLEGAKTAAADPLHDALRLAGWNVAVLQLRATGSLAYPRDKVGRAPDHNTAEWSLWIGRPLLGQWTCDVRRLLDAMVESDGGLPKQVAVIGRGPAGLVALSAAATDPRITHVAAVESLASYVTDVPYEGQRLGLMVPGILRDVGDVTHLAALAAPRRLVIAGGVHASSESLTPQQLSSTFGFTSGVYERLGAVKELHIGSADTTQIVQALGDAAKKEAPQGKAGQDALLWRDVRELGVEGQGWTDTKAAYDRLPGRAEKLVRAPVWGLSRHSAGLCLRFVSDAPAIHARWALTSDKLAMPHMPAVGVSGLDLYVRGGDGKWQWLAIGRPTAQKNDVTLASGLPSGPHEYMLYLPLYNGVSSVELGVPQGSSLTKSPPRSAERRKPIVFYGTSITQGGCASRPGMVHTAIIGRRLERPIINLGFSGNGKMDPEMGQLMAELDPAVYVIDCLPNMNAVEVAERTEPLVRTLLKAHPSTPILLVEDRTYANAGVFPATRERQTASRAALRKIYDKLSAEKAGPVYYLAGSTLLGDDGEATVDGSHPTDLGFLRQAEAFLPALTRLLPGQGK
jgi:cephalosporin-C deacetylase-like acetyl esterase